jgi:predicted metal-dependent phosphoesterase TrpH
MGINFNINTHKSNKLRNELIDLHTHTKASDGSLASKELIRLAKDSGLVAIGVTDHDTLDGILEAETEAKLLGIEFIAGVEISADYDVEMHILGYYVNGGYCKIAPMLQDLRENRLQRNPKIIKKLNEMGFNITLDEAIENAGGNVVGRPHIAKALMNKGYVESTNEAFEKYLSDGGPAYFKKDKLTPQQTINEIVKTGGIAVLAHPIYLGMSEEKLDELLKQMKLWGLGGVEAYYVDNSPKDTSMLVKLAEKHGLVATGGSDFHGEFKPDIKLGVGRGNLEVPYRAVEQMREMVKHKQL